MKNFYFDLCSIPVYLLILYTYFSRKIARFPVFKMFYIMNITSLICAILDIVMEFLVNPLPLSQSEVIFAYIVSFSYKLLRNAGMVIYLIFIFAITRTDYLIRTKLGRFLIWAPNAIVCIMLLTNFFTGSVFTVTVNEGYNRGPLLIVFYLVAMLYGVAGMLYCLYCRKFMDRKQFAALISVYVLTFIAVGIQMTKPMLMVEMFSTAIGLLIVMLMVMRPEENIDSRVGVLNYNTFQRSLHNTLISKDNINLAVIHMNYANENRIYLGDDEYYMFVSETLEGIRSFFTELGANYEVFYEHPDNLYLFFSGKEKDVDILLKSCISFTNDYLKNRLKVDKWLDVQTCLLRIPADLSDEDEIINLCHRFTSFIPYSQKFVQAADIVKLRDFEIHSNIVDILDTAINEDSLQMYYQPIYNVKDHRFCSAEALARIIDKDFGLIPPDIFIPAAERNGMIIPLGFKIVETVFRFISNHDLEKLGLSWIDINLSVAQCLQQDFPDIVMELQKKYKIHPDQVNFEITESLTGSMSAIMERNLTKLSEMGYTLSLDDYGTGYSSIQRVRKLPLNIIKIDKSLVDDIFTDEGNVIIKNTVKMFQGINKKLVVEGAETQNAVDILKQLSCEYIQGYYYSKPLPENEFIAFISENNHLSI